MTTVRQIIGLAMVGISLAVVLKVSGATAPILDRLTGLVMTEVTAGNNAGNGEY